MAGMGANQILVDDVQVACTACWYACSAWREAEGRR